MKRFLLSVVLLVCAAPAWAGIFSPKERVDFWRRHYTVLAPESGEHIAAAHTIFNTVTAAAGTRPGVIPQLLVIKETPYGFSLPVSLPDGGIVISAEIIERIFDEPDDAESKLAFMLGHELAHLYSEDFWHVQFFRLLTRYETEGAGEETPDYRSFLDNRDELIKKELFADEQGLLYMTLARYDPAAIVGGGHYRSFFDEWNRRIARVPGDKVEPLVPERTRRQAVNARLRHIADQSTLYRLGLLFFVANDYEKAVRLFEEYSRVFPGREVYHNLALSHHFAAVARYTPEVFVSRAVPFKFSFMLDPTERLFLNATRTAIDSDKRLYEEHLHEAIDYYKRCIQLDPRYLPAYINLATAQIGTGNYYAAIGHLMEVEETTDPAKENDGLRAALYNNLGIAFQLIGRENKARHHFETAADGHDSADARYNLARYYYLQGEAGKAGDYWKQFLGRERRGPFARLSRDMLAEPVSVSDVPDVYPVERIAGLYVNADPGTLPESRDVRNSKTFTLNEDRIAYYRLNYGTEVVVEDGRIKAVAALGEYAGQTVRGIGHGATEETVRRQYGYAGKIFHTPNGRIYNYPRERIGFFFRAGKLYSWVIY